MAVLRRPYGDDTTTVSAAKVLRVKQNRPPLRVLGVYTWHSPLIIPPLVPQTTLNAPFFIANRPGSAVMLAFRRFEVQSMAVAVAATSMRYVIEKFSYVGDPSGAQSVPCKQDSNHATPQAVVTTAATGITLPTIMGTPFSFALAAGITATETVTPFNLEWEPDGAFAYIRPGEAIGFRSAEAGAATDPRRVIVNMAWEEYELASV